MLPKFGMPRRRQSAMARGDMADLPKRHTIRRPGYDHAQQGAYYLTICTDDRRHWFGRIADGVMHPSAIGKLAQQCWDAIPDHMPHVDVGEFVVMPNHVHGIVVIRERLVDAPGIGAVDAPDTNAYAPGDVIDPYDPMPNDPGTGMPGGDPDTANAHGPHTRARHDAPLRDPRKPPGIPRGALGQIVASYKSAVTRAPSPKRSGGVRHRVPRWVVAPGHARMATQLLGPRDP
ncbi:MAG: hypothetical protein IT227_11820 [Flavobacteriales bacterium]|nr:hypothetical protein [Flavobacteriales bacterium]